MRTDKCLKITCLYVKFISSCSVASNSKKLNKIFNLSCWEPSFNIFLKIFSWKFRNKKYYFRFVSTIHRWILLLMNIEIIKNSDINHGFVLPWDRVRKLIIIYDFLLKIFLIGNEISSRINNNINNWYFSWNINYSIPNIPSLKNQSMLLSVTIILLCHQTCILIKWIARKKLLVQFYLINFNPLFLF